MSVPYSSKSSIDAMMQKCERSEDGKDMPFIFKLTPREGGGFDCDAYQDYASMGDPVGKYGAAVQSRSASTTMPIGNFSPQYIGRNNERQYPLGKNMVRQLTDPAFTTTYTDADGSIYGSCLATLAAKPAKNNPERVYFSMNPETSHKNKYVEGKLESPEDLKARFERNLEIIGEMKDTKKTVRETATSERAANRAYRESFREGGAPEAKAEAETKGTSKGIDPAFYQESTTALLSGHMAGEADAKKMSVIGSLRPVKNGEGYVEVLYPNRLLNENLPGAQLQNTYISDADAQAIMSKIDSVTDEQGHVFFAGSAYITEGTNATKSPRGQGYGLTAYGVDIDSLQRDGRMTTYMKNCAEGTTIKDLFAENKSQCDLATKAAKTNFDNAQSAEAAAPAEDVRTTEVEKEQATPGAELDPDMF